MTGTVREIPGILNDDTLATEISTRWATMNTNRQPWLAQNRELRNYVFATDTSTTTNSDLPWKNSTTLPKICQIRDNLHANYMAALFPNDNWLRWEAYTLEDAEVEKKEAIEAYMSNKLRLMGFQDTISKLIYDYIDYGNCFADAEYIKEMGEDIDGNPEIVAQGPKAIRKSPLDVVFNLAAPSFAESYHIIRYIKTIGEIEREVIENPDSGYLQAALDEAMANRLLLTAYSSAEIEKAFGITIDGFGSYSEYLQSDYVEIFEFRGDIRDVLAKEYHNGRVITVIDRRIILRNVAFPNWFAKSSLVHGGWRYRPDNVYAMGPLENLVGMQYRIDHLENIKADFFDLVAQPPLLITGQVEEFEWQPFEKIWAEEGADVKPIQVPALALQADTGIAILEQKMEEFAGAPKQAIGARTPGEKTAFEVQTLEQNSTKMFQEKIVAFEINVMEPLLNFMLELAKRHLDGEDVVSIMDTDLGVQQFVRITKRDIVSKGKIRPVGARHFALRAQTVQNYMGFRQMFGQDPGVMNHISGLAEAEMFEDLLGYERYDLVRPNVRLEEMAESNRLAQELDRGIQEEQLTPADEDEAAAVEEVPDGEEGPI